MSRLLCVFSRIRQKGIKPMTENEKKLLQAKHRLEEAEMRDRQKERKARTRRLIQEGAILEKVLLVCVRLLQLELVRRILNLI